MRVDILRLPERPKIPESDTGIDSTNILWIFHFGRQGDLRSERLEYISDDTHRKIELGDGFFGNKFFVVGGIQ